jgi:hypothetical protein
MNPQLTLEQEEEVERRLADILLHSMDEIAEELGIHPRERDGFGEWTAEEASRIIAECDEQYRDGVIETVLMFAPPD